MLNSVREFMTLNQVPRTLCERVLDYVVSKWANTKGVDQVQFLTASSSLIEVPHFIEGDILRGGRGKVKKRKGSNAWLCSSLGTSPQCLSQRHASGYLRASESKGVQRLFCLSTGQRWLPSCLGCQFRHDSFCSGRLYLPQGRKHQRTLLCRDWIPGGHSGTTCQE